MRLAALLSFVASVVCLTACPSNGPDPALTCESDEDCPAAQSCLQHSCLAAELPDVLLLDPEDGQPFAYGDGSTPHAQTLTISATNLVLGSMQGASEAVIGEGYLVVFVDEVEVGVIDSGDLGGGVQMDVEIPDVPGVHRIRVQARLHDGTDYDNETGAVRSLVWVDDGREHVALRRPWPNDAFSLEAQKIEAEIAVFGGLQIGRPASGLMLTHVFYDASFPACLEDPQCEHNYHGLVPSNDNEYGPVLLPESAAGTVTLTALVANSDHTTYSDDLGDPVWSTIQIMRSAN